MCILHLWVHVYRKGGGHWVSSTRDSTYFLGQELTYLFYVGAEDLKSLYQLCSSPDPVFFFFLMIAALTGVEMVSQSSFIFPWLLRLSNCFFFSVLFLLRILYMHTMCFDQIHPHFFLSNSSPGHPPILFPPQFMRFLFVCFCEAHWVHLMLPVCAWISYHLLAPLSKWELAICGSSLEGCIFSSLAHRLVGCFGV